MIDIVLLAALVGASAWLFTTHVALAFGLGRRAPRWRGVVAFFVPPLAPYWGWRAGLRVRAIMWAASLAAYVLARIVAAAMA